MSYQDPSMSWVNPPLLDAGQCQGWLHLPAHAALVLSSANSWALQQQTDFVALKGSRASMSTWALQLLSSSKSKLLRLQSPSEPCSPPHPSQMNICPSIHFDVCTTWMLFRKSYWVSHWAGIHWQLILLQVGWGASNSKIVLGVKVDYPLKSKPFYCSRVFSIFSWVCQKCQAETQLLGLCIKEQV